MKHTLLIALLLAPFSALYPVDNAKPSKPDFVIVMGDDISWTSFGCVNPEGFTRTPNIDQLTKQGMRFTNFRCASAQCAPVRHELYTALLPPASGMYRNGNKPEGTFKNVTTWLGDLGYAVGLAGKLHFSTKYPFKDIPGFTGNCNSPAPTWNMGGVKEFIGNARAQQQNFCLFLCSVNAHHPWTIGEPARFPVDKVTFLMARAICVGWKLEQSTAIPRNSGFFKIGISNTA